MCKRHSNNRVLGPIACIDTQKVTHKNTHTQQNQSHCTMCGYLLSRGLLSSGIRSLTIASSLSLLIVLSLSRVFSLSIAGMQVVLSVHRHARTFSRYFPKEFRVHAHSRTQRTVTHCLRFFRSPQHSKTPTTFALNVCINECIIYVSTEKRIRTCTRIRAIHNL